MKRLSEMFTATALSIVQSRSFDASCIVVHGCIAAIADSVMRKMATDKPSEACAHLMGKNVDDVQLGMPGFGISVGIFAAQSESIQVRSVVSIY